MIALADAPQLSLADAERIARDHFGIDGHASALTSERDQNFLITSPDRRVVLKVANAAEDPVMLEAQHAVLTLLASKLDTTPRVIPAVDGSLLVPVSSSTTSS